MRIRKPTSWIRPLRLVVLCAWPFWLAQACAPELDPNTTIRITVQDSTGKPLPDFALKIEGFAPKPISSIFSNTLPDVIQEYQVTTDQSGIAEQSLRWNKKNDKVDYYSFSVDYTRLTPNYDRVLDFSFCESPLTERCGLRYRLSMSKVPTDIVLRAKFR